jgi:hypothetical protein
MPEISQKSTSKSRLKIWVLGESSPIPGIWPNPKMASFFIWQILGFGQKCPNLGIWSQFWHIPKKGSKSRFGSQ